MRRIRTLLCLVASLACPAALLDASDATAARSHPCKQVANHAGTGAAVGIRATNASCRTARRLAARCVNAGAHPGWSVTRTGRLVRPSNTAQVLLTRGSARITMGFVGGSNACYPEY
ncbi:hypothetical protein Q5424_01015 [Conexibacter sp. JD483]|uniref:hypothetical protein n=1 Tax=unclassified Conexibacter TaxID=2627773 RepID=UPI00271A8E62|nr:MULTISPECIES: hypothetical protein [unclassified Conexibacter]MDO8185808.1 hypothetical protein [Conexibacter sp. CPCC 205706]MDO8198552.1 hypothetical protein [Conexibacter sp. CPCC 205762]MDR9367638.1 hypothetical protein [Conexibacter sp. JD483]